jgi:hypothetical protein
MIMLLEQDEKTQKDKILYFGPWQEEELIK